MAGNLFRLLPIFPNSAISFFSCGRSATISYFAVSFSFMSCLRAYSASGRFVAFAFSATISYSVSVSRRYMRWLCFSSFSFLVLPYRYPFFVLCFWLHGYVCQPVRSCYCRKQVYSTRRVVSRDDFIITLRLLLNRSQTAHLENVRNRGHGERNPHQDCQAGKTTK